MRADKVVRDTISRALGETLESRIRNEFLGVAQLKAGGLINDYRFTGAILLGTEFTLFWDIVHVPPVDSIQIDFTFSSSPIFERATS
jgi:hypothetical protein